MKIAVLLTCHNRQTKTKRSLSSLLRSFVYYYKKEKKEEINMEVFLTDDGCTDGTVESVQAVLSDKLPLHIIKGDGALFWAGGMRLCWKEAMKRHIEWDYYLLLNDDVELMDNMFDELFTAESFAVKHFGQEGLISGITCDSEDCTVITYGGDVWKNRFLGTTMRLKPSGMPQICDFTNANILLVPKKVVDTIGIFYEGFKHGKADYDYSNTARKAGIPVIITANPCGKCDKDHLDQLAIAKKVTGMSLKQRKEYFLHPIHSCDDYLRLVRRTSPLRAPMVWFGRKLNIYLPKLYYKIEGRRWN